MAPKLFIGKHPSQESFGGYTSAEDCQTKREVPHRALIQHDQHRDKTVQQLRAALVKHHASAAMIARDQRIKENLRTQGYPIYEAVAHRFPRSSTTRKGNLAEVFLAEYICAASDADLPIYRLRYNPNVEQSMKGDDVLAFDFSSKRPCILVGEAKYRGTPSKQAVQDIVRGLIRSHQAGLPVSLQFVADRLYEANNIDLADRVADCSLQMAKGRLKIRYVGLLLSNAKSKSQVDKHTDGSLRKLVMISLGMGNPAQLVQDCFEGIEVQAYGNSK